MNKIKYLRFLKLKFILIPDLIAQDFISEYRRLIAKEFTNVIENINYLCGKAPENETILLKTLGELYSFTSSMPMFPLPKKRNR